MPCRARRSAHNTKIASVLQIHHRRPRPDVEVFAQYSSLIGKIGESCELRKLVARIQKCP